MHDKNIVMYVYIYIEYIQRRPRTNEENDQKSNRKMIVHTHKIANRP